MTSPVKTGIIGCGRIAERAHAPALQELVESDFFAACDVDLSRAESMAATFGAQHAFNDINAMLRSGVEAILVCTPHPAHEVAVVSAARAGVHSLCEKPVAIQLDEIDRMIDATESAGVNFGVIFQRRFWPAAQRLRAAIDTGEIGTPTLGTSQSFLWRSEEYFAQDPWRGKWATEGGGVLMNQAVHVIDLLQWYMGPVTEVYGRHATLVHGNYIDVEDTAVATIAFESGSLGLIQAASTLNPPFGFKVAIHGANGVTLGLLEDPEGTQGVNDVWTLDPEDRQRVAWEAEERNNPGFPLFHKLQIQEFLQSIQENRQPAITGHDGRISLAIIQAIYESERSRQPVRMTD